MENNKQIEKENNRNVESWEKIDWVNAIKRENNSFGELRGFILHALELRLMLVLFGIFEIFFGTWFIGILLVIYGVINGNSIYKNTTKYILSRCKEDKKYYNLMLEKKVIKK